MSSSDSTRRWADDSPDQFLRLLSIHEQQTQAFIFSLLHNWADAEDIAQEVRLKLWEQFDQYDSSKDFGAWARTIAYYHVLTFRKRSRRQPVLLSETALDLVAETYNADLDRLELRTRLLQKCIDKLTESKRQLLLRCYHGRETIRQIAERVGRSFDAVQKSVLRMRHELAKCVERELEREDGP